MDTDQGLIENNLVNDSALARLNRHQEQVQISETGVAQLVHLLTVVYRIVRLQYNGKGLPLLSRVLPKQADGFDLSLETCFTSLKVHGFSNDGLE
jgi:hypothetical protein